MGAQHDQAARIFDAAVELGTPAERAAYLDAACGQDADLRAEVEELLAHDHAAGSFLNQPARLDSHATADELSVSEGPGTVIGPYKLLEQIGEGGFGVVFMAEQHEPLRRKVALKVLKPGMDTRQVIARFEAERQALALMDHPNIAKVLDAGTTDGRRASVPACSQAPSEDAWATGGGRPFFVMELVRGLAITDYCDQNQLTPRERLELFVPVCRAVQHAHQKGIIHRDLKPSNILVTRHDGVPVPKVIDFGIAKALAQQLTDKTLFTGFAQLVGTPLYMSPEQADLTGVDIDTRTDIYALGMLLYELLTGTTPFDKERLHRVGYDELRRIVREEEPPKPSTRLSTMGLAATTISAQRQTDPRRLSQLFRGELDWIVMKALEKDRNRRYETASAFAADVQRYLNDELVEARPPSVLYRCRKLVRRHKRVVAMASFAAAMLVMGMGTLVASNVRIGREKQQKDEALQQKEEALERERQNAYYTRISLADRELSVNNLSRAEELLDLCPPDLRGWEWHYLRRLGRGKGRLPLHHDAAVLSAAISPGGDRIASADQLGFVKIWDLPSGQLQYSIHAYPRQQARCVAFSPDGQRLASACWDGTVTVSDVASGRCLHSWKAHPSANRVAFSSDGRWLVSAGGDEQQRNGEARIWDATTYAEILALVGLNNREVRGLALSPDSKRLAMSFVGDPEVKVWDAQVGRELLTLAGHTRGVNCVAFSPDGRWIASGCGTVDQQGNGEVKIWDSQTGQERLTLGGHMSLVWCVAFSPDGRRLATGGGDHNVKIWDLTTGQEALTLREHRHAVWSVAFSPDGHRLVSASCDRTIRLWDGRPWQEGEPGQELLTLRGHANVVNTVAFHPKERQLASSSGRPEGVVKIWDLPRWPAGDVNLVSRALRAPAPALAFSPDGKWLATGSHHYDHVKLWDVASAQEVRSLKGRTQQFVCAAFSPNGERLAAAGFADWTVDIWDVPTGHLLQSLTGHNWGIHSVAFCPPDGRYLASGGVDGTLRIWDTTTGQEIVRPRPPHQDAVCGVAFSRDGRLLASGSNDRTVRLWEKEEGGASWKPLHVLADPTGGVKCVAFSPDGRLLAWGGTDSTVKVADLEASRVQGVPPPIITLHGHTSWVEGVAFSPDGRYLASGSRDGTVKIWEAPPRAHAPEQAEK
jgi:WD40 repeat protein/serine/threonine protein kinase